jgi:predicted PurR-regulated permease PerM
MSFPPPTEKQARVLWFSITVFAISVVLLLIGLLGWGLGWMIDRLSSVLLPLAIAGIIAYILDPVVSALERRKLSRPRAIVTVFAIGLIIVTVLALIVIPPLVAQTERLIQELPNDLQRLQQRVNRWMGASPLGIKLDAALKGRGLKSSPVAPRSEEGAVTNARPETNALELNLTVKVADRMTPPPPTAEKKGESVPAKEAAAPPGVDRSMIDSAAAWAAKAAPVVLSWLSHQLSRAASLVALIAGLALVPIYVFYFLAEKRGISKHWADYLPIRESRIKEEVVFVIRAINDCLIVFFRGQVLVAICDGILYTIGFLIIGLPYALLLGALATVLTIIPFLGAIVTFIAAMTVAVAQFGDWQHPAMVVAVIAVVQTLEGFVIQPKIIGDRVGLHPVTIIIALMVGTSLMGGILGGILAIPLCAALRVILGRYVWKTAKA